MGKSREHVQRDIKLFGGSGCSDLAEKISQYLRVPLSGRDLLQFSNENIFVQLHESVRGQDVFLIQTTSSPVNYNIMEMLIFLDTLKRASPDRITVVIPYLSYARSDKKDMPRVPITARLLADLIGVAGADRYITLDLHAGQIQGFFSIPGDALTTFSILSDHFRDKQLRDAVVVAADLG
ncbi:MAG: ribose-phosphate diphosphokinase, partial [Chloroflexi bacterium]|nr:ribose-phosphate diphosphokinase [Chloroflexota bacterium]